MRYWQPRFAASARFRSVVRRGAVVGVVVVASLLSASGIAADQFLTITDAGYSPAAITIHQGETVTWLNSGAIAHTVTAADGSFDSGPIAPGERYANVFTEVGTFSYGSSSDPAFHGRVEVLAIDTHPTASPTSVASALPFGQGHASPAPSPGSDAASGDSSTVVIAVVGTAIVIGVAAVALVLRRR